MAVKRTKKKVKRSKKKKAKRKFTQEEEKIFDELAELMKDIPPERLYTILRKGRVIQFRVSGYDHADIKSTSSRLGLTTSEYLLRLHYICKSKISGKMIGL